MDSGTTGLITSIANAVFAGAVAGLAWLVRFIITRPPRGMDGRQNAIDEARVQLDAAQANTINRLEATIGRLERERAEEATKATIWERQARRADWYAHEFRHVSCNLLMRHGYDDTLAPVPLLETAFQDDAAIDFPQIKTPVAPSRKDASK